MEKNMWDQFYSVLTTYPSMNSVFTVYDVVINFTLPVLLLIPLAWIYRRTHRGVTYNQNFVHTMFIMAVTTSVIMMIIGSNIARAFSLVGALSIIRFRTAVKDSKDTGYIFLSIAMGMASGTGLYLVALTFSALSTSLMAILNYMKIGQKTAVDKLLKFQLEGQKDKKEEVGNILMKSADEFSLIHTEFLESGDQLYTYILRTAEDEADAKILNEIREFNGGKPASIFYNDQRIEI